MVLSLSARLTAKLDPHPLQKKLSMKLFSNAEENDLYL